LKDVHIKKGNKQVDKKLLQESFDRIAPDIQAFSLHFYQRLFAHDASARELFTRKAVAVHLSFDEALHNQARSFANTLTTFVISIEQGTNIANQLSNLGHRHSQEGATSEHYKNIGIVLLECLEEYLGDFFTSAVSQTWKQAYEILSIQMQANA
jgi:nitric oxide dioxygenase